MALAGVFTSPGWVIKLIFDRVPCLKLCWYIILRDSQRYFQQYTSPGRVGDGGLRDAPDAYEAFDATVTATQGGCKEPSRLLQETSKKPPRERELLGNHAKKLC